MTQRICPTTFLAAASKLLFQLRVPLHCQGGTHDLNAAAQREVGKVFLVA